MEFKKRYPEFVVAQAYETNYIFFIETKPEEISDKLDIVNNQFNYGICSLLKCCPKDILILAAND